MYYIFNLNLITKDILDFYKNNYNISKEQYYELIEEARKRGNDKSKVNVYSEEHHIIPRCLSGTNDSNNLVLLTYKEHILAHMLLYCMNPEDKGLFLSFSLMIQLTDKRMSLEENLEIDLNAISELKNNRSEFMRGDKNPMKNPDIAKKVSDKKKGGIGTFKGKHHTEETKQKLREITLSRNYKGENHPFFGKHHDDETRKKISEKVREKNPWLGRHHKEESKKKLAEYHKVKVVGPDGTIYDSVEEAAKQVGIHRGTLFRYLRENPEKGWKRLEQ